MKRSINSTFLNLVELFYSIYLFSINLLLFRLVSLGPERSQRVCLDEGRSSERSHGRPIRGPSEEETGWNLGMGWR